MISPLLDGYDVHQQVVQAKKLNALDPHVQTIFYFNTKHVLRESLYPKYLHGFDPATMALHDANGRPVRSIRPGWIRKGPATTWMRARRRGTSITCVRRPGCWRGTLRRYRDGQPAPARTRHRPHRRGSPEQCTHHSLEPRPAAPARQVRARFPGKTVLYNGISQTVPGQIDRDLGPLDVANGALNEEFCLERGSPNVPHIRNDLALMATAARRHKLLLEKVNYDVAHAMTPEPAHERPAALG